MLVYSRSEEVLDEFKARGSKAWDVVLAVTHVAAVEELRARHVDLFVTDEPSWVLILRDRFPYAEAREVIVRSFFETEYFYSEFLREYRERYRELSDASHDELPIVLIGRRGDATRNKLIEAARTVATSTVSADLEVVITKCYELLS